MVSGWGGVGRRGAAPRAELGPSRRYVRVTPSLCRQNIMQTVQVSCFQFTALAALYGSHPAAFWLGAASSSRRFWLAAVLARGGSMVMGWVVSPAEPPQNRPGNANEKGPRARMKKE